MAARELLHLAKAEGGGVNIMQVSGARVGNSIASNETNPPYATQPCHILIYVTPEQIGTNQ